MIPSPKAIGRRACAAYGVLCLLVSALWCVGFARRLAGQAQDDIPGVVACGMLAVLWLGFAITAFVVAWRHEA